MVASPFVVGSSSLNVVCSMYGNLESGVCLHVLKGFIYSSSKVSAHLVALTSDGRFAAAVSSIVLSKYGTWRVAP